MEVLHLRGELPGRGGAGGEPDCAGAHAGLYGVVRTSATSLRYGGPGAYAGVPPPGSACKVVVPYVLNFSRTVADFRVRQAGLVPVFTGAGAGEPWVGSQSPAPFTEVAAGSEVRMRLESGSIP